MSDFRKGNKNRGNKAAALNLIGNTTWAQVEAMGVKRFIKRITDLLPDREVTNITRLPKHYGSHVNGPSNAVEGFPSEDHNLYDMCYSTYYISSGHSSYSGECTSYISSATMCHCNLDGIWECSEHWSSQVTESNC